MNYTRDLHLCGICKNIFCDLNFFLEHKSHCTSPQIGVVLSPNPQDISLENGLFCNETVLDLTVLDNGSFLPIFHCDNEEVVSDAIEIQAQEEIFRGGLEEKTQEHLKTSSCHQLSNIINEKDGANLIPTQLSKEVVSYDSQQTALETQGKDARKILNSQLGRNGNPVVGNEQEQENINEKIPPTQGQKNICKICNFVSAYHKDLVRHMRKHTGERPYMCSVCDKKFARQDKLTSHKRIHDGDKRYKCQICEYATTDSSALRKHLQIHKDERPHKCQMCSYRARNASHMTVHLRTHTGDSPFFCQFETCGKTFKTSTDLKRHLKVHKPHSSSPSYSTFYGGTDNFSCNHVAKNEKAFFRPNSCYVCQNHTHKGEVTRTRGSSRKRGALALCIQRHKCSICRASFVRQDSLRSHLKQHHLTSHTAHDNAQSEVSRSPRPCSETRDISSAALLFLTSKELQSIPRDENNTDNSFL